MKGQFQESKETEIINIIKIWLVKTKERLKNTKVSCANLFEQYNSADIISEG